MTNKKASIIIGDLPVYGDGDYSIAECQEAKGMAIEALTKPGWFIEKAIEQIDFAINATNLNDSYSVGMRNGLKYAKSLLDNKKPEFDSCEEEPQGEDCIMRKDAIETVRVGIQGKLPLDLEKKIVMDTLNDYPSVTPKPIIGRVD